MRIPCPHCGERSIEEFVVLGAVRERPDGSTDPDVWHDYVYLRENPAGLATEYVYHQAGCRAWLVVTRDTRTHRIASAVPAQERPA